MILGFTVENCNFSSHATFLFGNSKEGEYYISKNVVIKIRKKPSPSFYADLWRAGPELGELVNISANPRL